jgi:putative ABC transport system permease protein
MKPMPPRLALSLINRCLDAVAAESISGDLTEGFAERLRVRGAFRARIWFWAQAVRSVIAGGSAAVNTQSRTRVVDGLMLDVRIAIRSLRGSPAYAATAILTLTLGIGASVAIGTAADRALRRGLPVPAAARLVAVGHPNKDGTPGTVGFLTVQDWRARTKSLDELSIVRGWTPTLVTKDGAERLDGARVSWNYFRMLGVTPALGRDFVAHDDAPDRPRVVIISDGVWKRRFAGRPDVVGSSIEFNGRAFQVAGVLPPGYEPMIEQRFNAPAEVWTPLAYGPDGSSSCRSCQHLRAVGRLAPGATLETAHAELVTVQQQMRREHPSDYEDKAPVMRDMNRVIAGALDRPLRLLVGAVLFVLLVACANVASLLVTRASARQRELAVRAALGAGRARLAQLLLVEAMVVAAIAGTLGVLLAQWSLGTLASSAPVDVPRLDQAAGDPRLILLAVLVSAGALFCFGLIPAWFSARVDLRTAVGEERHSPARHTLRLREFLIAGQIAVSLVLVAGAGLMYRTVDRLLQVNPGFDAENVLTVGLSLVGPPWAEDEPVRVFQRALIDRVSKLPGVESAALTGQVPLGGNYDRMGMHIVGRASASEAEDPDAERYSVSPGYFRAMGIPLIQGRLLNDGDRADSAPVMLLSASAAREFWPGGNALGQRIRVGNRTRPPREIVGIVGDVRHYALSEQPTPQFYLPQEQFTDSYLLLVVKMKPGAGDLTAAVRAQVRALAPDVPLYDIASLDDRLQKSIAPRRFLMLLLGLFAGVTVLITAVGLYGVIAQVVAAQQREFGIRVALGARKSSLVALVLRRGLSIAAIGILLGLGATVGLGRLLSSQLYETQPADLATLSSAAVILFVVAIVTHLAPLRRALQTDPNTTLRAS